MKRRLLILLAAGILATCPSTAFAESEVPVAEEMAEQTTPMAAEAPEAEAPVTEAPQTQAPETAPPQTQAPETAPPETASPATEAPQTKAPATEAPQTEAATQAEQTSQTEAQTAAKEKETQRETKKAAEEVTEKEAKREKETKRETEEEPQKESEPTATERVAPSSVDVSYVAPADVSANAREIYAILTNELGLNHAGACAVLANIQQESGLNSRIWDPYGVSYGLCQWLGPRYHSLVNWCAANGYDKDSVSGQTHYLIHELETGYTSTLNALRNAPNTPQGAYDAALFFCVHFESPAYAYERGAQRGNSARSSWFGQDLGGFVPALLVIDSKDPAEIVLDVRADMEGKTGFRKAQKAVNAIHEEQKESEEAKTSEVGDFLSSIDEEDAAQS